MTSFEGRNSDTPIEPIFLQRWSPRAFTGEAMDHPTLLRMFEAARWAPSSYNSQPWRYVYAHRDTPAWARLFGLLAPANQSWAHRAAVLLVVVSKETMAPRGTEMHSHSHSFDTGSACENLSLQATAMGWHTHGMVGFDIPRAAAELGVPEGYRVEAMIAIGKQGDRAVLSEQYAGMEQPNGRNPVASFAFEGAFPAA